MALRLLLGAGHSHGPHEEDHRLEETTGEHESGEHTDEQTLDLRVAAIFVILAAAMIMGLPPIYMKYFKDPEAVFARVLRAFAGGIILGLALVHIIPEALFELAGLTSYNYGPVTVLGGIFVLVIIDSCLQAILVPKSVKDNAKAGTRANDRQERDHERAAKTVEDSQGPAQARAPSHTHQCMRSISQESWVASTDQPVINVKQYVMAYTMELGCIFHSVIIGVSLGVMTESRMSVVTMMIALAIHQGLEGLSLGCVLGLTSFSKLKKTIMLMMYCLTTPLGIAIGIAVSGSYNPSSVASRAVQGVMNGISGGMLLYIAMYQLIAEEFSRQDLLTRPKLRTCMYVAMLLGGAAMCVLAIWS